MASPEWVLSLDVGATHISAGLVNQEGKIRFPRETMTRSSRGGSPSKRILALAERLVKEAGKKRMRLAGIAAGVPGLVDHERGILVAAGNLPELFGYPLGPELENNFNLPAVVENDVNAQALGEMLFGAARGVKNFVLFSMGTDLGGGIVVHGRLLRGAHNLAAEFGHLTLELDGAPCFCGGRGCAREFVSGAGLAEKYRQLLEAKGKRGEERKKQEEPSAKTVFEHAARKEPEAEELVLEFLKRFGALIANVMKVMDPELVVLAGAAFREDPGLLNQIVAWTRRYYFPLPQLPEFRLSELDKETAVLGPAASFFLHRRSTK